MTRKSTRVEFLESRVVALKEENEKLRKELERYACDSALHTWGNDLHPCFGYGACKTLDTLEGSKTK